VARLPEPLWLAASDVARAWRPAERRLTVPAPTPIGRGHSVAVHLGSKDDGLSLAVTGLVVGTVAGCGCWITEVEPNEKGAALLQRLLEGQGGGAPPLKAREPRYGLTLPVVVTSVSGKTFMTTVSASEGGCGLAWSGPPPRLHAWLYLRLGSGQQAVTLRGMVRWVRERQRGLRVGIHFVGGDRSAWAALFPRLRVGAEAD
jgi:hypothetical protein